MVNTEAVPPALPVLPPEAVAHANAIALRHIEAAEASLVAIEPARAVLDALGDDDYLHAGPDLPDGWASACGALRGSLIGAILSHGRAGTVEEARLLAQSGRIRLRSAADFGAAATFAGVIGAATPVFVARDPVHNTRVFTAINEGRGRALRYGCYDPETVEKTIWIETAFAPVIGEALKAIGPIDLFEILGGALSAGDDGHSRQKAASFLFARRFARWFHRSTKESQAEDRAGAFLTSNEVFFLPLAIAAARLATLAAESVAGTSVVTAMSSNGAVAGIRVGGDKRWFTAPAPRIDGVYLPGRSAEEAGPFIGDSAVIDALGFGAAAIRFAPELVDALRLSPAAVAQERMDRRAVALGSSRSFVDGEALELGVDVYAVARTGIAPAFNAGIASAMENGGQVGIGHGRFPLACFESAARAFSST